MNWKDIAITEAGRVQIEAQLRSFDAMGYDALEVITEPGACPHCKPHDEEIVALKDARMGENIPMFHPFCRCSTAAAMNRLDVERMFAELERDDVSLSEEERFQKIYESVKANNIAGSHREYRGMMAKNGESEYNKLKISEKQFGKKAGKHMREFGLDPSSRSDRNSFLEITEDIVQHHQEVVSGVNWQGQPEPVIAYIKGHDAVITKKNGEYIITMKGGASNARIENARRKKV